MPFSGQFALSFIEHPGKFGPDLRALAEVRLRVVARVKGQFAFRVEGNAGLSHTVQASSDLLQAQNFRTLSLTNATASAFIFVDVNAPPAQRFDRVT
jgi:hypothetical protein